MRIGMGYDVHRLVENRDLIIGGVRIPYEKGLLGHSDADVLLHAVMDALLGAAALGDIGKHFPDTDPKYKDIASTELLMQVMNLVRSKGINVVNVDTTVILQSPKLGPYKNEIRKVMSKLLGVDESCFSVKAKTAEHMLGELGTGDAVVCQSVCLVSD